jgi:hypothetical protein
VSYDVLFFRILDFLYLRRTLIYRDIIILHNNLLNGFLMRLDLVATKKRAVFGTFLVSFLIYVAFFIVYTFT